jgi:hypothetical protein
MSQESSWIGLESKYRAVIEALAVNYSCAYPIKLCRVA